MTAASETHNPSPKRQQATGSVAEAAAPARGSKAWDALSRMRVVLGGRDFKGEVHGLANALKHANAQQAGAIVEQLFALGESPVGAEAFAVVAGVFTQLEAAKAERAISAGHGLWDRACAIAIIDPDPACRASTATLIGRLADPEVVPLLGHLLRDSNPEVAEAAGRATVSLADRLSVQPALDGPARLSVHQLIARSVDGFDTHRRREALGALLIICGSPAALRGMTDVLGSWLNDPEHSSHMVLRGMIRRADGFATRESAWTLIAIESYRTACADRLCAETDPDGHARVLSRGHLLENPARAGALTDARSAARRGHVPGLEIDAETASRLPAEAARFAPRWANALAPERVESTAEAMLCHPSAHARLNAVRELGEREATPEIAGLLSDLAFDADPLVARSALTRAAAPAMRETIGQRGLRVALDALTEAASAAVRDSASLHRDPLRPGESGGGAALARRMLRADRERFVAETRALLRHTDAGVRMGAIRLIQRLHLGAAFELELLAMVSHSSQVDGELSHEARGVLRCGASAVQALAELASPAALHAVQRCLRHTDARIRANAMDALARTARRRGSITDRGTALHAAIVEFKSDPAHRVRAGAVRASMLTGEGEGGVTRATLGLVSPMLTDERPMHRVSGLWLAERVVVRAGGSERIDQSAADALAGTIADLVRSDPDPDVRLRARQTASRVLAAMRGGWADRARAI